MSCVYAIYGSLSGVKFCTTCFGPDILLDSMCFWCGVEVLGNSHCESPSFGSLLGALLLCFGLFMHVDLSSGEFFLFFEREWAQGAYDFQIRC